MISRPPTARRRAHARYSTFRGLRPGALTAKVSLDCQRDSWADEQRVWHTEKGLWRGMLTSSQVQVKLPA